jgi:hypothetical protein
MQKRAIHISKEDAETLEAYAREHDLTVDEVVHRFVQSLQDASTEDIHPDVQAITGLVPPDVNAEQEYRRQQLRKHEP